jgi:hypothetical protein
MMRRSARVGVALVAAVLMLCAGSASAAGKTLWLCKPGLGDNPCEPGLAKTIFPPPG